MQEARKRKAWGSNVETVRVGHSTVSIYVGRHSTGRTRWRVVDTTAGARRFREFLDRGKAFKEATRLAGLLNRGEQLAASLNNREAGDYGKAAEFLRPTGASLALAASTYAEAVSILGGDLVLEAARYYAARRPDQVIPRTVAEAAKEFVAHREARGAAERYTGDMRARLMRFADDFQCPIASVTTPALQAWLDGLGLSPRSVLNFRRAIGTLFAFAESRGYVAKGENPAEGAEGGQARSTEAVTLYTAAEARGLLLAASPGALPVMALCAFAGLRVAEALRLDWRDIDLAGGWITVSAAKAKTRSRRLVPVLDPLRDWIASHHPSEGPLWSATQSCFTQHQQRASAASKIAWKVNAFRHTWISARLALTHDAAKVALEAGNSPAMIFAHYRELLKPDAAEAWFAVRPEAEPANVVRLERRAA